MSVTATLDHFQAVSEFWHYRDTCGETAGLVLEHCKDGVALDGPDVDAVRNDMAAKGYGVQGGTTMSQLVDYFRQHRGLDIEESNHYGDTWDNIHQTLLDHAGRDGILLQVNLASRLTGNEPGVRSHYVAIGAIHPTLGYLVANGDDVMALNSHGGHGKVIPCRWMDKNVILTAQPRAVALVHGLPHTLGVAPLELPAAHINADGLIQEDGGADGTQEQTPVEATSEAPSDAGDTQAGPVYFDTDNIAAFRNELQALLQQAQATVDAVTKALASLPETGAA